ncbi:MAG: cytidylate kinase-like family protein [Firmicutes bacterium]|jgi:cytidylate kinase|nr:cytidylate kinase-like family protein [Bacillota bacterium]
MKRLVTISREYGSGGRIIGKLLAEKIGVPFYDREIIDLAVNETGFSKELIEDAELKAKNSFVYGLSSAFSYGDVTGNSSFSVNEKLFLAQFKVIREIGEKGEGVIVGRCADYVLKDIPGVTNVFVYAEHADRVKRAIEKYGDDSEKADHLIATYDKARQNYYNYHTCQKWGDYRNYNLSINSSYITEEEAAALIAGYVERRTYR